MLSHQPDSGNKVDQSVDLPAQQLFRLQYQRGLLDDKSTEELIGLLIDLHPDPAPRWVHRQVDILLAESELMAEWNAELRAEGF